MQPDRANYPHQQSHRRPGCLRLHPAPPMTRYPRHGPKESINNSSPITGRAPATPSPSRRRSSLVPRREDHCQDVARACHFQKLSGCRLITNRTFTATGSVNSTAKRDKADKTLVLDTEHTTLVHQEQKDWDPQSMMMILDSLDAIRWAWILIQISAQEAIDNYIERFIQLTRKNPQRLPNVKEAWDTFSWTIAMRMRNNVTFKQATEEILQDPVTIADILSQPVRKKIKPDKDKGKIKGKGKGKTKNKAYTWQNQYRQQPYPSTVNRYHILPVPSQGTAQGQEEQAITEPQRQRQTTTKIGTAQRLGRSIPAS